MHSNRFIRSIRNLGYGAVLLALALSNIGATTQTRARTVDKSALLSSTRSLSESKIVFSGNDGDLYVMNSDGSSLTDVTNGAGYAFGAEWSPDGSQIAFEGQFDGLDHYEIYLMKPDGSGRTRLSNTTGASGPTWSPDGSMIAFEGNIGGVPGTYVMRADGTGVRLLGNFGSELSWAPDASKLAYTTGETGNSDIYTVNIDGTGISQLTNATGPDYLPRWSPDGTHIAFVSERDANREIYSMKADGTEQTNLTHTTTGEDWPSWSPDGSKIVYSGFVGFPTGLWVVGADGNGRAQLTFPAIGSPSQYEPDWSPFIPMSWTVMVYLDGDQNGGGGYPSLDTSYSAVFNQLENAANNRNVNTVVAWDRAGANNSAYYKVEYDTDPDKLASYEEGFDRWSKGELDMGSPTTLSDFVQWARGKFPAQHYALLISDHGTGLYGTAVDSSSGNDLITVNELGSALAVATANGASKLDIVFADSCLMAMIEDEYQIRNYADIYIASENALAIPRGSQDQSRPYSDYITGITTSTSPQDLAGQITSAYASWVADIYPTFGYTISAVDLTKIDPVVTAISNLGAALGPQLSSHVQDIKAARDAAQKFDSNSNNAITSEDKYVDLSDLAAQLKTRVSDAGVQSTSQSVIDAVNNYVLTGANRRNPGSQVYSAASLDPNRVSGVSIFFPSGEQKQSYYSGLNLEFAADTQWNLQTSQQMLAATSAIGWGPLLVDYVEHITPSAPDDPNPPDLSSPVTPDIPFVISGNAGTPGALVSFTGGSTIADANGDYQFDVSYNWTGTVTPSKTGVTFIPTSRTYSSVMADRTGQSYKARQQITSTAARDGWVLESGELTGKGKTLNAGNAAILLGDDGLKRQYRGILSFNTSGVPLAAVVDSLQLKLTRQSIAPVGSNPFAIFGGFMIDLKKGFFGGSLALEAVDFQATPTKSLGPFSPNPTGATYTVTLPSSAFGYVNRSTASGGVTQVRVRFKLDDNNNSVANTMGLYSGSGAAAYRPTLIITYHMP